MKKLRRRTKFPFIPCYIIFVLLQSPLILKIVESRCIKIQFIFKLRLLSSTKKSQFKLSISNQQPNLLKSSALRRRSRSNHIRYQITFSERGLLFLSFTERDSKNGQKTEGGVGKKRREATVKGMKVGGVEMLIYQKTCFRFYWFDDAALFDLRSLMDVSEVLTVDC